MANSKHRPGHDAKAAQFAANQKKQAAQAATPKTHLVPDVEWQSTDTLPLRGDVAEAIQNNIVVAYESLQRAGQAFQVFLNHAIKAGAAKITYTWNNGEKPTEAEIAEFTAKMEEVKQQKAAQAAAIQKGLEEEAKARETGLVTAGGQPLTEENLESEKGGLIV